MEELGALSHIFDQLPAPILPWSIFCLIVKNPVSINRKFGPILGCDEQGILGW
jgi:hypothetical protein